MKDAAYWISALNLQKHVEGGWFREVYRSEGIIPAEALPEDFQGRRNFSTSIYFLLQGSELSSFHRIKSDETWHYYEGTSPVAIVVLTSAGPTEIRVGNDFPKGEVFQTVVPSGCWFGAYLPDQTGYALVGCTVSPGFDYRDFELADPEKLMVEFPGSAMLIRKLGKETG
jgi:uncharacterized protein